MGKKRVDRKTRNENRVHRILKENEEAKKGSVNLWRRFSAYLIDWFVGTFFAAFPVVMLNGIALNMSDMTDDLLVIPSPYNYIGGALAIAFSFIYFVIIPLKVWKGETVGKHMMNLKIVKTSGGEVDLKALVLRQMVGMVLVEGVLFTSSNYLREMLALATGEIKVMQYLYYVGIGVTIISIILVIFTYKNQAIHDRIGKTKVIMNINKAVPNIRKIV